ncbi:sugar phosphate isomerase/epimerase [Burkholderia stabilis]|uniref:Sugar phosphate isomerase/epimerase n=1 Tax=Burkholderia stabilis TaxID=95485 RepID=A0A4Q2AV27_9BURK|nr:sugar phosphate isomerase/epimerase family protein [Burkholderia stabilis]RXV74169.1 sugar phosphate isomerase/epimerase [Burkholderia stabilis]
MRLAISNIAWDVAEDAAIAALLKARAIDAIDIAPGKYFPAPASASNAEIIRVKHWWQAQGIEITGMQALLFGTSGLNVFGPADVQQRLLEHLAAVCRIGEGLGASRIVFGSPKNRDRSGLTDHEALAIAVPFFRQLGDIAQAHNVIICLEPNPAHYGANFMLNSAETAHVVQRVDHPAIKMQFDTGALAINGEAAADVLRQFAPLIGHIHASEPDLVPLGDGAVGHQATAAALQSCLPDHIVTIEMVATKDEPHLQSVERALDIAVAHYRPGKSAAS